MPGVKNCAFLGCVSNKKDNPQMRFYKFPTKRKDICDMWVVNCANPKLLDLSESALACRIVCELHFEEHCFTSVRKKCKLISSAVPSEFQIFYGEITTTNSTSGQQNTPTGETVSEVIPSTSQQQTTSSGTAVISTSKNTDIYKTSLNDGGVRTCLFPSTGNDSQTPRSNKLINLKSKSPDTPRKIKLKQRILKQKQLIHNKSERIRRTMCKKASLTKESAYLEACKHIKSKPFRTLLRMQMLHKSSTPWSEDEKELAIEMHYRSPSLFKSLKIDKKFQLPDTTTISRWLSVANLMPGISAEVVDQLKAKVKSMSDMEKEIVLIFDEMSIKKCLSYNQKRDIIEGFEDLGSLGRQSVFATHVLMFLIRGLYHRWKMPFAYFLSGSVVGGNKMSTLLKEVLTVLTAIGLWVRVVVCDGGKNNTKAISLLNVTPSNPYFINSGKKVFVIYDTPHIIKCVRNNLLKHDITYEGGQASWRYIEEIYSIDVNATKARALCKLTPKHLHPNAFDKMKVKLATQVQ